MPGFAVFETVFQESVDLTPLAGGAPMRTASLRFGVLNDDRDLYMAFEWDDPTFDNMFDAAGV